MHIVYNYRVSTPEENPSDAGFSQSIYPIGLHVGEYKPYLFCPPTASLRKVRDAVIFVNHERESTIPGAFIQGRLTPEAQAGIIAQYGQAELVDMSDNGSVFNIGPVTIVLSAFSFQGTPIQVEE